MPPASDAQKAASRRYYEKNKARKIAQALERYNQQKEVINENARKRRAQETPEEKEERLFKRFKAESRRIVLLEQGHLDEGELFINYTFHYWESGLLAPPQLVLSRSSLESGVALCGQDFGNSFEELDDFSASSTKSSDKVITAMDAVGYSKPQLLCPGFSVEEEPVKLLYPGKFAADCFPLVRPKHDNAYDPMVCLTLTVSMMYKWYLCPKDQQLIASTVMQGCDGDITDALNRAYLAKDPLTFRQIVAAVQAPLTGKEVFPRFSGDIPKDLLFRILEETTQRGAALAYSGIHKHGVKRTPEAYGELFPCLASVIFEQIKLKKSDHFVDLGSGLGLLLYQASAQVGCSSFGVELRENLCEIADKVLKEFSARCRMWNVSHGPVAQKQGDMFTCEETRENLRKATAVIICNKVFDSEQNLALTRMIVELLPDGARVVSLKPLGYLETDRTPTPRKLERCLEELQLPTEKFKYAADSVSWTHKEGDYFISTVKRGDALRPRRSLPPNHAHC